MSGDRELVDVVGVGLNAVDTLIRLPHFPSFNSKMKVLSVDEQAGGGAGGERAGGVPQLGTDGALRRHDRG